VNHTLMLDEMGGVGQKMRKICHVHHLFSFFSIAWDERVCGRIDGVCGLFHSAYSPTFKVIVVFLMAVGVILTPCSQCCGKFLRRREPGVNLTKSWWMRTARGVYHCLSVGANCGIGLYPKLLLRCMTLQLCS